MIIGIPKETFPNERRVALVPAAVPSLTEAGLDVVVEAGAGQSAGFPDGLYQERGARIGQDRTTVFADGNVILQVRMAGAAGAAATADLSLVRQEQVVIGLSEPLVGATAAKDLAERGVIAFSMELMPRITRAQSIDVLSSMATISEELTGPSQK